MNHFVFSAALASLFSLITALIAWCYYPASRVSRILGTYWFSIAFWSFFVGSQPHSIKLFSPFWWGWFLHLGCTFIPVLLFHFVVLFTKSNNKTFRFSLVTSYVMTGVFNLLNLLTPTFTYGTEYRDWYAYPKPAIFYPIYFAFFIILVIWSTILLVRYVMEMFAGGIFTNRFRLFLLLTAHVLAYMGGMDNFLIMADIRIPPLYPYGLYPILLYALATIYNKEELCRATT